MRQVLPMHARGHRLGGSDPLDVQLPFIQGVTTSTEVVTSDIEVDWDSLAGGASTNDRNTFAYDDDDGPGLLIKRQGIYHAMASVRSPGIDVAVERGITLQFGLVSNGPLPGADWGATDFYSGVDEVTATSDPRSVLWIAASHRLPELADVTDPYRVAIGIDYRGTSFTLAVGTVLRIIRLGTNSPGVPPLPPTA